MATPSVTYTFNNGTTADAGQVNTNFTDVINSLTDGNNDLSIAALTCSGTATLNGSVVLGNAGADDLTISASLASSIPIKTNDSFDIGSATLGLQNIFLGGTGGTTAIKGAASITTYTMTLPGTVGVAGQALGNSGSGALEWIMAQTLTAAKSAAYVITDTDKVRTVLHTAGASAFDVTFPTAADNTNRIITVKKVDSGAGIVTVKSDAAGETIDGVSGTTGIPLAYQYDEITAQCDGSDWHVISNGKLTDDCISYYNNADQGSVSTATVLIFNTKLVDTTIAFSSNVYTCKKAGIYNISFTTGSLTTTAGSAGDSFGFSIRKNTTAITGVRIPATTVGTISEGEVVSVTLAVAMAIGDTIDVQVVPNASGSPVIRLRGSSLVINRIG